MYRKCHDDSSSACDTLGLPYDYDSILHSAWWWYSKTGTPGMEALNGAPLNGPYGQLKGLSQLDVKRINKYYGCSNMINCDDSVDMYDSKYCDYWSKLGFCFGKYGRWMKQNCNRSYGFC